MNVGKDMLSKMHSRPTIERWKNARGKVVKIGNNEDEDSKVVLAFALGKRDDESSP